jgi:carbonic anhydrase
MAAVACRSLAVISLVCDNGCDISDTQTFPELAQITDGAERFNRLCEINVIEQVANAETTTVLDAWEREQKLAVHGWIYGITDGLLRDLDVTIGAPNEISARYRHAIGKIG